MDGQGRTVERKVARLASRAHGVVARVELLGAGAVRACGEGALLSGRAAGWLWGLLKGPAPAAEVTAPTERRVKGVRTTRARRAKREATKCRAIPVTTVARTLVDLAAVVDEPKLARACHEAGVVHHTTPAEVDTVLARRPRSPGAGKLRRIMRGDTRVTLSRLESRFLERLKAAGLRRYTYGDVVERPKLMMAELRALLKPQRPALVS
jgi:hypothetical protein